MGLRQRGVSGTGPATLAMIRMWRHRTHSGGQKFFNTHSDWPLLIASYLFSHTMSHERFRYHYHPSVQLYKTRAFLVGVMAFMACYTGKSKQPSVGVLKTLWPPLYSTRESFWTACFTIYWMTGHCRSASSPDTRPWLAQCWITGQ